MAQPPTLYPRATLARNFGRGAGTYPRTAPLFEEIAARLTDRLLDSKRTFPMAVDLGCGPGTVARTLPAEAGVETLVQVDLSHRMLTHARGLRLQADVEQPLPLALKQYDLVMSNMLMHWINNVPQFIINAGRLLKNDGLFLASTLGVESFMELRTAFAESGDDSPHIIPLTDVQSAGAALQQVGYALPVIDRDTLVLEYTSFTDMYADLRSSGARNLHPERTRGLVTPRRLKAMEQAYRNLFGRPDGTLPLTVDVLYLHGWRPDKSQQKPLPPGSARISLHEVLAKLPPKGD